MFKTFARNNKPLVSIILFLLVFIFIHMMKPAFLYNRDNSLREFGVGYKNTTILPLWLFSIILGILIYVSVMYYSSY
jgi:hypothetical protein